MRVLSVNAGSSSIKVRLLDDDELVHQTDLHADRGRSEPGALEQALDGWTGSTPLATGWCTVARTATGRPRDVPCDRHTGLLCEGELDRARAWGVLVLFSVFAVLVLATVAGLGPALSRVSGGA